MPRRREKEALWLEEELVHVETNRAPQGPAGDLGQRRLKDNPSKIGRFCCGKLIDPKGSQIFGHHVGLIDRLVDPLTEQVDPVMGQNGFEKDGTVTVKSANLFLGDFPERLALHGARVHRQSRRGQRMLTGSRRSQTQWAEGRGGTYSQN